MYKIIQESTWHVLDIHSFYYLFIPLFIHSTNIYSAATMCKYYSKSFPSTMQEYSEEQNI